jgi:histidine triad (HIT) family protein
VSDGCLFCAIVAGTVPAHMVAADDDTVAFLDLRPVFKGHTLVVPRRHVDNLVDLPAELIRPVFAMAQRLAAAMAGDFGAAGSFVAVNNTVSQSQPHLHVHVVPRNRKDGLRGFFWPRTKYADDAEAAEYADRLRAALR